MAIKEVLMIGNPKLREKSLNVTDFTGELLKIIKDLKDTLIYLQKEKNIGRALAAPQIGHMKKVVYYNLDDEEIVMVNPEIIWKSDEMFDVGVTHQLLDIYKVNASIKQMSSKTVS